MIMADPPWDIHMELPYGTLSDDEMRQLPIPVLQDEGLIFLWVTGRAMELGREVELHHHYQLKTDGRSNFFNFSHTVPSTLGL